LDNIYCVFFMVFVIVYRPIFAHHMHGRCAVNALRYKMYHLNKRIARNGCAHCTDFSTGPQSKICQAALNFDLDSFWAVLLLHQQNKKTWKLPLWNENAPISVVSGIYFTLFFVCFSFNSKENVSRFHF